MDLNLHSNIILVGNGPSALSKKVGKYIDKIPIVVRFNSFRLEGYEEYVGTKTDIWLTTDVFPAWQKKIYFQRSLFYDV